MLMRRIAVGLALAAVLIGCTLPGSPDSRTSSPATGQPPVNAGGPPPAPAPADPKPFAMAHVTAKLTDAGFADVQLLEKSVNAEVFGVPGQVLKVKDAQVNVYLYADEAARSQVKVGSDPSHVELPGGRATIMDFVMPPRVVIKGNVIIYIFSQDADLGTKLWTALNGL